LVECAGGGSKRILIFEEIICVHNLFEAWDEFKRGKLKKQDVQDFLLNLESNIFRLHQELASGRWVADPYIAFYVRDPKLRHIHKASVRDRVLYQAVYRILYRVFDPHFISDSYSCRDSKGLHKGFKRLEFFIRKSTRNYRRTSYALKCDVRKFFDSISHDILYGLISRKVTDKETLSLTQTILASFSKADGVGLPLGNVTSQLFANIYLNELDQFIKHTMKAKYYARYCDDFVMVDSDVEKLRDFIPQISNFLSAKLKLDLHPNKISIRKVSQGVDFLGFISMSHHSLLRTKTKNRIFKKTDQMVEGVIPLSFNIPIYS
jgi:retron-type reverse transcriptase